MTSSIYLLRAQNEILAADILFRISQKKNLHVEFSIPESTTFYSSVISHSYYAIFYAAKALLIKKGIVTKSPDIHRRTYEAFQQVFVNTGVLDVQLLLIYKELAIKAEQLLFIFREERWKRGNFTYAILPQANESPAQESLAHSKLFVSAIQAVI